MGKTQDNCVATYRRPGAPKGDDALAARRERQRTGCRLCGEELTALERACFLDECDSCVTLACEGRPRSAVIVPFRRPSC